MHWGPTYMHKMPTGTLEESSLQMQGCRLSQSAEHPLAARCQRTVGVTRDTNSRCAAQGCRTLRRFYSRNALKVSSRTWLRMTPGLSSWLGSKACLMRAMMSVACRPHSISTKGAMLRPVPCSPCGTTKACFSTCTQAFDQASTASEVTSLWATSEKPYGTEPYGDSLAAAASTTTGRLPALRLASGELDNLSPHSSTRPTLRLPSYLPTTISAKPCIRLPKVATSSGVRKPYRAANKAGRC